MTNNSNTLEHQLVSLTEAVHTCESARVELAAAQSRLTEICEQRDEQLQLITHRNQRLLKESLHQLEVGLNAQRETLELDFRSQSESFRSRREGALHQLEIRTADSLTRLTDREDNEVWVLQSVFDDEATDSPREKLEREKEAYRTQKEFLNERNDTLQKQLQRTQDYLACCHASMDSELPPPAAFHTTRLNLAQIARDAGDSLLSHANDIDRLILPHWVRGLRVWLLSLLLMLVLFFPLFLSNADLSAFLNPDMATPNWNWLAVSAVVSLALAGFAAVMLIMMVQQRMRPRCVAMLQNAADARQAVVLWEEKSELRHKKLEHVAEKWLADLTHRREERVSQLRAGFAAERQVLEGHLSDGQIQFAAECQTHDERLRSSVEAERQRLIDQEQCENARLKQEFEERTDRERSEYREALQQEADACRRTADEQLQAWTEQVQSVRSLAQESSDMAAGLRKWPSIDDPSWQAAREMPRCVSPGDLLLTVPKPPDSVSLPPTTNLCIEMPAVQRFPGEAAIVVEHDAEGRDVAVRFLRTQILRLLTVIPPGRIRFTLIDPVSLGQSFSAMMHLADYDELLIHSRIWTEDTQIRDQLRKITEHMENVFQTYLRSEFATIEDYNESAGEVAEPYHFVVIAGFPQAFSSDALRHLSSILASGPNCGVHALVAWNPAIACSQGFNAEDLTRHCVHFRVTDGDVIPARELPANLVFEAIPEPIPADYVNIVKLMGAKSRDARRVEVSFRRVAPRPDAIWSQSTANGIDLPIGRAGAARLQFMRLGQGTSQHVMIAGKTGSGKSTFLHIVITNLALHFSPTEIQFYLIDFKKGVEFRTYAANQLPHARVVAIESDREFGLSVLERVDEVLQERGDLFRTRGVQDVPAFRKQFPEEPMPRLLLLIDEFQEFFVAEDRVASRASLLLDRLVRQGRAFGIHVMLGSQTLGGAYSLARSTLGQVAVRVALQCSETDAHLILSEDNSAARLLTRPGEAIYNDANGLKEGNHPFQIAWLDEEYREELIHELVNRRTPATVDTSMIVFEGNVPPTVEQCGPLRLALRQSSDATSRTFDARSIWLGEPVAIAAPTQVELRRAGGQNLLLVGQDEDLIDSMLALAVLTTCHGARDEGPQLTLLHSERNEDVGSRFNQLAESAGLLGFDTATPDHAGDIIRDFASEVGRREEQSELAAAPERLLVIRDIGQFRDLRREDEDFSLGSFGEPKVETTAAMLGEIIRRGPLVGIHTIVWADTFNNAMRWLSNALLREFEDRIVLRMNQTDSASLVDSPVAAGLGPGRAILYRDQTGAIEKFRPFAWPSDAWLRQVASWTSRESDDGLDIESLRIE